VLKKEELEDVVYSDYYGTSPDASSEIILLHKLHDNDFKKYNDVAKGVYDMRMRRWYIYFRGDPRIKNSIDFLGLYRRFYFGTEDDISWEFEPVYAHADFD